MQRSVEELRPTEPQSGARVASLRRSILPVAEDKKAQSKAFVKMVNIYTGIQRGFKELLTRED